MHLDDALELLAVSHRSASTPPSKTQRRLMSEFKSDADRAVQDIERHVASMDDAALPTSTLSTVQQQIELDERMFSGWHEDEKSTARRLIDYERETLQLIEEFIESATFRRRVTSIWNDNRDTNVA